MATALTILRLLTKEGTLAHSRRPSSCSGYVRSKLWIRGQNPTSQFLLLQCHTG